jgi:hypothetical protein
MKKWISFALEADGRFGLFNGYELPVTVSFVTAVLGAGAESDAAWESPWE